MKIKISTVILILFMFSILLLNHKFLKWKSLKKLDVYVLFVPKREDYIKKVMKNLHLNPTYIQGPDKDKLAIEGYQSLIKKGLISQKWIDRYVKDGYQYDKIPYGRIACHLGHINILKTFLKSNKEYALIFEDDIYVNGQDYKKNNNEINKIAKKLPKDGDIFYLGYCWEYCNKSVRKSYYFDLAFKPLCRHIYIVNKKAAKAIIDKTLPMTNSGDQMISNLIKNKDIKGYTVNPDILNIRQNRDNMGSQLGNSDKLKLCYPKFLQNDK